jgi:hypothetical protein
MLVKPSRKKSKSTHMLSVIVFLFGLSLTSDVIYVAMVGNTPVYCGYLFGLVLSIYYLLKDKANGHIEYVHKSVWAFTGIAMCSLMVSLVNVLIGLAPEDAPVVVLRGLVVLLCGIAIYYATVRLGVLSRWLLVGIMCGLVANGILSLAQQAAFATGSYISLYRYFPQEHFYIAAPFEIWSQLPQSASLTNLFRPQGLFLEASHLVAFLACFAPIVFLSARSCFAKMIIVILTGYCSVAALSPNAIFLVLEIVTLFIMRPNKTSHTVGIGTNERDNAGNSAVGTLAILGTIVLVAIFLMLNPETMQLIINKIASAFDGLNMLSSKDTGTLERLEHMQIAAGIVVYYPFGAGWNTESYILRFWFGDSDVTSLSFAIRLLIEVGIPGFICYLYLIYSHAFVLLKKSSGIMCKAIGVAVICLFVIQVTNGTSFIPWTWALLGLAQSAHLGLLRIDTEQKSTQDLITNGAKSVEHDNTNLYEKNLRMARMNGR